MSKFSFQNKKHLPLAYYYIGQWQFLQWSKKIDHLPPAQSEYITFTNYTMDLFYKNGTPTDIIYYGKHARFYKKMCSKNKFAYIAEFDEKQFIHDGSHLIAEFDSYSHSPTIWICNDKKQNKQLNGPSRATQ